MSDTYVKHPATISETDAQARKWSSDCTVMYNVFQEYCLSSGKKGAPIADADDITFPRDLAKTYWVGANLTGAFLKLASLRDANLEDANLMGADLMFSYFTNANLTGANLTGAELKDSNLTGANLTRAELKDSNLTGANLTGATLDYNSWGCTS